MRKLVLQLIRSPRRGAGGFFGCPPGAQSVILPPPTGSPKSLLHEIHGEAAFVENANADSSRIRRK